MNFEREITAGATSVSVPVLLRDATSGAEVTGKMAADIAATYWRQGGYPIAFLAQDLAEGPNGIGPTAWIQGGWGQPNVSFQPGLYRLDVPNAAFATGADWVVVSVKVAGCSVYYRTYQINSDLLTTILGRLGSWTGSGLNTVLGAFQALSRKDAAVPSDLGGTYAPSTDSLEAARDNIGAAGVGLTGIVLAMSPKAIQAAVSGLGTFTIHRGDNWTAALTDIGSLVGWTKLWFTVKRATTDSDDEALIEITASGGLVRLNGAAATNSSQGSITVVDEPTGDLTIVLSAAATALLAPHSGYRYDIQMLGASGIVTRGQGELDVIADVTRAAS